MQLCVVCFYYRVPVHNKKQAYHFDCFISCIYERNSFVIQMPNHILKHEQTDFSNLHMNSTVIVHTDLEPGSERTQ